MTITTGDRLPAAKFIRMGAEGPQEVSVDALCSGRKIAMFAVPGAFTPTCSSAHVPSFMRVKDALLAKGVDEVVCISVNDAFVMKEWGDATGATQAGITMLADADGAFTAAIGMDFTAAPVGLIGRSKRYAMLVDDGVVRILNPEASPGECEISAGETLLDQI